LVQGALRLDKNRLWAARWPRNYESELVPPLCHIGIREEGLIAVRIWKEWSDYLPANGMMQTHLPV
jgi:hypothetical protein